MQIPYIILALLLILVSVIIIRTLIFSRSSSARFTHFEYLMPNPEFDPLVPAQNLAAAIRVQTISHEDPAKDDPGKFRELHDLFERSFPRLHATLKREVLKSGSLLYTWQGSDTSLDPVLFMAHQDVVPADEHTLDQWTHPPFSGELVEGFVWGRGSLDIKGQLVSVMQAVEFLLLNGFEPQRSVYLAFGHDEEVLGSGAPQIVELLKSRGIHLAAVLDEGTSVLEGVLPGFSGPVAAIGNTEKGYLSLKFTVEAQGGHSSMPSQETAIGILSKAIVRLQANPFPYHVKAMLPMFRKLAPVASPLMQVAFANTWLFGGLLRRGLAASPQTAAAIHTTTAPTIFHGGVKENVLPSLAEGVVNFRILAGENIASVCERVRRIIDDERVTFAPVPNNAWEPSPVSPSDSPAFRHIESIVADLFLAATCAPNTMLGATDARHYHAISESVYRFTPILVNSEDLERLHGINERISLENLSQMVRFFYYLIQRWSSLEM